jgi:hypothetical protein
MAISRISKMLLLFVFFLGTLGAAHADSVFNFDSDTVGENTTFTDTNNGVSATFSSPSLGGFEVLASSSLPPLELLSGNVLTDTLDNASLAIAFSSNETSIFMDFATSSSAGVPFVLTAFENGAQVGQVSASGAIPSGFTIPEGVINFSGVTFNSVSLTSTAEDFAIDNVDVQSVVPEPSSFWFLGVGLLALFGAAKRRVFAA